jgi:hypothetical protein
MSLRRSGAIANSGQPIKANRPDECQMATAAGQCMRRRHDRASSRWLRGVAAMVWVVAAAVGATATAAAEEVVSVGGGLALLNRPASARAGVILIPGGNGALGVRADGSFTGLHGNQLVRTRKSYMAYGIATLTIDQGVDVATAVTYMRQIARTVVVVGTSRGTLRVPASLSARPDGIVLTSGFLDNVRSSIGSPAALPPTLVVHHREDGCSATTPAAVDPFKAWGGAKVRVTWMNGGANAGNPCEAMAHHGFSGLDGRLVATVAQFTRSVR